MLYFAKLTGEDRQALLAHLMGQCCFARCCLSASSVVVCNVAGGPGAWAVGRPTLHGGPVRLRPVTVTPCLYKIESVGLRKLSTSARSTI